MKGKILNFPKILILLLMTNCVISQTQHESGRKRGENPAADSLVKMNDIRKNFWDESFKEVEIPADLDGHIQKAFFYRSRSSQPRPLVVSLHTWSGDYKQKDELAALCQAKDLNYIHPDFRGANRTKEACCSEQALRDIDQAITYAIANSNVDTSRVYLIGVSGGGYATLSAFMQSDHRIKKFSAWASITDLAAWYQESCIRGNNYAADILACTGSEGERLDENLAKQRSPLYWPAPNWKLRSTSSLDIYAGIYDGIQGSVPITHSINFYNKLLSDLSVADSSKYVSDQEKLHLLEYRRPLGEFGNIGDREVCLVKEFKNIRLTIFQGNHEMLTDFALDDLLRP